MIKKFNHEESVEQFWSGRRKQRRKEAFVLTVLTVLLASLAIFFFSIESDLVELFK